MFLIVFVYRLPPASRITRFIHRSLRTPFRNLRRCMQSSIRHHKNGLPFVCDSSIASIEATPSQVQLFVSLSSPELNTIVFCCAASETNKGQRLNFANVALVFDNALDAVFNSSVVNNSTFGTYRVFDCCCVRLLILHFARQR
jgi:hypothetical protein